MAILVLQDIIRKPTLQMYYSKRESICTPFFSKVIPRERFLLLCKFLHSENNTNTTSGSKLRKIEKLVKIIEQKFKTLYIPTQDICIAECLELWKGRLSWKQYIPSKRSRFGIKFYAKVNQHTFGISAYILEKIQIMVKNLESAMTYFTRALKYI